MLQNCSIFKIAEIFFKEPTKKHSLVEISEKSNIAHTSVKAHLKNLAKGKIIIRMIEKKGKRDFPIFVANINNPIYKLYKRFYNNLILYDCGLVDFLKDNLTPKSIVLFGSYSFGEDTEVSDIDLFIEARKSEVSLKDFEKKINRKIEIHFNENFKSYPAELKNNILNGTVLYGYLEVFR